ncbi:MAG TPA: dTDP-4-keto-6-deoxy-D-glucose epimerase [candidate division WWE3 bacterium]|uniref:dTDP-4-keto-6-deoxy-D-glucose epimerase n=1 Tax=candidate division WWE3 bacterium TaxID=2053526 RepID=A0A7V5J1R3_UNCKA|nr:dTDP-4-keto-6-deoxy-D-glucose epimerase [candidate division WWE3 bacterium]
MITENMVQKTGIDGLFLIKRKTFADERGFFREVFRQSDFKDATGIDFEPVQWNHSYSKPNVIRAIHSEAWNKLVYPVTGKMFAAIVDLRPDSPTFAKVETFIFDNTGPEPDRNALFISKGLGNSICVFGDTPLTYMYLVDDYWGPGKAAGIAWDDPDLNINWPVKNPIISERDKNNPTLREAFPDKFK